MFSTSFISPRYLVVVVAIIDLSALNTKIPVAVSHFASLGGDPAFHIYISSVLISILGVVIFLMHRCCEDRGSHYKLPLLSVFLLLIGSVLFAINGVYWFDKPMHLLHSDGAFQ